MRCWRISKDVKCEKLWPVIRQHYLFNLFLQIYPKLLDMVEILCIDVLISIRLTHPNMNQKVGGSIPSLHCLCGWLKLLVKGCEWVIVTQFVEGFQWPWRLRTSLFTIPIISHQDRGSTLCLCLWAVFIIKSQTFVGTCHPFEVISERRLSSNQVGEYSYLCRGHRCRQLQRWKD